MEKTLIHTCRYDKQRQIVTTIDGERVCRCGTVLEEKLPEDGNHMYVQTNATLYLQLENGGDPKDMKVTNKGLHIHSSSLSEFSNICNKLNLPDFVQKNAWMAYHKFRSMTYYTRAKCALFSIYNTCRETGIAVDEPEINEAIHSVMGVKNVPSVLSAMYEMRDDALGIGIDTNKRHSSSHYLNLALSENQHYFEYMPDYERFKVLVMEHFNEHLIGNLHEKAVVAANMALRDMKVTI